MSENVVEPGAIPGVKVFTLPQYSDARGVFVDTYLASEYANMGVVHTFVQDNYSVSHNGVLRGFHGDFRTYKLLHVPHGAFQCVLVDLRPWSPTFGKIMSQILSAENRKQLYVPPGMGNGALCLEEGSVYVYKQSQAYLGAKRQFTLRWDYAKDVWDVRDPFISKRDADAMSFQELSDIFAEIAKQGGDNVQGILRSIY